MSRLLADLRVLYHLAVKPVAGRDHAARLESFYAGQAESYDQFRQRLLPGRAELFQALPAPEAGRWIDLGAGTGANIEGLGDRLARLRRVTLVDLSPSLLQRAQRRITAQGWRNVETVEADATTYQPEEPADVVTLSYALTMIPDWFAALDNVWRMLRPGGWIGVVDFFVARKHPPAQEARHGWASRVGWPTWFAFDNVFLSPDHLPYLRWRFRSESCVESRARLPYLPLVRAPYYRFIGRKSG